jgi:glycosyltransferase involved in cell wall biosynthesis
VTRPAVLSVVIPAFNEEPFIGTLLERVRAVDLSALGVATEIVVVDDCSTDDTARCAEAVTGVRVWRQAANRGKGAAVRAGLARASGDYIVIQDADLEYDPQDYAPMLSELLNTGCDAVYGSRYSVEPSRGRLGGLVTGKHAGQSWPAYIGGRSLSLVAYVCTGARLTDTVTALKLFRRTAILDLPLTTDGFELDAAEPGRGEEDRRAGLGGRRQDVRTVSAWVNQSDRRRSRTVAMEHRVHGACHA